MIRVLQSGIWMPFLALVQKRQFASDVRRLFASYHGATPKPSTKITRKRSASYEKRRRWLSYLRHTYIRCDAHCPAALASRGRAMCVAHGEQFASHIVNNLRRTSCHVRRKWLIIFFLFFPFFFRFSVGLFTYY